MEDAGTLAQALRGNVGFIREKERSVQGDTRDRAEIQANNAVTRSWQLGHDSVIWKSFIISLFYKHPVTGAEIQKM